jgi:hypothetical protein
MKSLKAEKFKKCTVDYLILHDVIMHKFNTAWHLHRSHDRTWGNEVHIA